MADPERADRPDASRMYDAYWGEGVAGWHVVAGLSAQVQQLLLDVVTDRSVLDFGGGDGDRYGRLVSEAASEYVVTDVSHEVLRRRAAGGVHTTHIDDLKSMRERFEVVICLEVLEHLLDPGAAVRTMVDAVRPGGQVLVSVPNAFSAINRARMLTGRMPSSGVGVSLRGQTFLAPHIRFFDLRSLVTLVTRAGLVPVGAWTDQLDFGRYAAARPARMRALRLGGRQPMFASTLFVLATKPSAPAG